MPSVTPPIHHAISQTLAKIDTIQSEVRQCDLDWAVAFSHGDRQTMQRLSEARINRIKTAGILTRACLLMQKAIHGQKHV